MNQYRRIKKRVRRLPKKSKVIIFSLAIMVFLATALYLFFTPNTNRSESFPTVTESKTTSSLEPTTTPVVTKGGEKTKEQAEMPEGEETVEITKIQVNGTEYDISDSALNQIKDGTVNENYGTNRFNIANNSDGRLNESTGDVVDNTSQQVTEFVSIGSSAVFSAGINLPGQTTIRYCLYDGAKSFLSGGTIPSLTDQVISGSHRYSAVLQNNGSAKYVRISFSSTMWNNSGVNVQIENGTTPTAYVAYEEPYFSVKPTALPQSTFNADGTKILESALPDEVYEDGKINESVLPDDITHNSQLLDFATTKTKKDYIAKVFPLKGTPIKVDADIEQSGVVVHCGKNLFDQSQFLKNPSITFDGEWYYGSGGQFNNVLSQLVLPPFKPHTTYIMSYTVYASADNMYWKAGFISDDERTRYADNSTTTAERRVIISTPPAYSAKGNPASITGIAFTFSNSGYIHIKDFMIVEADYDDETFAPYIGETVEVQSPYHAEFTAFDGENNIYAPGGTVSVDYFAVRKSHRENAIVVCMGDSITGNYPSATVPDSYPDMIEKMTGMYVSNCGFGGCRMSLHVETYKAPFSFCSLADAIVSGVWTDQDTQAMVESNHIDHVFSHIQNLKAVDWSKVEYITLFYGTNDWTGQVPLDNPENPKDTSTFLGSFRYGYEKLMGAYPNIKFIVITPMYRFFSDPPSDTETKTYNGKYIYDFGDALIDVCKGYHIPYIDMYRESGVNAYTRTNYIDDGTHPTEAGIVNLANIIGGKVMSN